MNIYSNSSRFMLLQIYCHVKWNGEEEKKLQTNTEQTMNRLREQNTKAYTLFHRSIESLRYLRFATSFLHSSFASLPSSSLSSNENKNIIRRQTASMLYFFIPESMHCGRYLKTSEWASCIHYLWAPANANWNATYQPLKRRSDIYGAWFYGILG